MQPTEESPIAGGLHLGDITESITVDQSAARRQLRIAGFSGAVVGAGAPDLFEEEAKPSDDETAILSGLSGIGSSLTATGGLLRPRDKRQAERSARETPDNGIDEPHYQWPVVRVDLNKGVMADRVSARRPGISREEAWAAQLDAAYRRSVWKQAKPNLLVHPDNITTIGSLLCNTAWASFLTAGCIAAAMGDYNYAIKDFATLSAATTIYAMVEMMTNYYYYGDTHFRDRRWSLMPMSAQADRLVLAGIALQVGRPVFSAKRS